MQHKKFKIIWFLAVFFALPNFAWATPSVSGVSGALSDGNSVTITGSSFGASPNVLLFDDFESGTVGQKIKTGAGSAKYGQWVDSKNKTYYGNSAKISGSQSFTSNMAGPTHEHQIIAKLPYGTNEFFSSYWIYLPESNRWPGEDDPNRINWKQTWVLGDGEPDGIGPSTYDNSTVDDDVIIPSFMGDVDNLNSSAVTGNSYSQDPKISTKWLSLLMHKGQWLRIWVYMKGSSGNDIKDGETSIWSMQGGASVKENLLGRNIYNLHTGGAWDTYNVNAYGRLTENCTPSFDDVYIATGPNAQARVEVGNASTYTASTKLTILTPISWGSSSISAQVNKGNFTTGPAYLYVFDSTGAVNAIGYPVTFGTSGLDTSPPSISSTSPTSSSTGIIKNSPNTIIFNENINCATVNTSSVTMSPNNISSISCNNSVITITPTNQADSTPYSLTASTAITDTSGNHLASPYTFSYTTATPSATCNTDATLCTNSTECINNHPTYNFCLGETPACKQTACNSGCSNDNWYLCTSSTDCIAANQYWWENACRTTQEPLTWYGVNLLTNPNLTTWSNGLPTGWSSYQAANVEQVPMGARVFDGGHILQSSIIEPETTYVFAYNLPVVNGSLKIWYYNTDIFNYESGTITGTFTTPAEPISDHGIYFGSMPGSDNIISNIVLKKALTANCATDPTLCLDETSCTTSHWNYCTNVCQTAPCILPPSTRSDVNESADVTTADALLTLRHSLGLSMVSTAWMNLPDTGDVNCDSVSASVDALLILRYSLGMSMEGTGWCEG